MRKVDRIKNPLLVTICVFVMVWICVVNILGPGAEKSIQENGQLSSDETGEDGNHAEDTPNEEKLFRKITRESAFRLFSYLYCEPSQMEELDVAAGMADFVEQTDWWKEINTVISAGYWKVDRLVLHGNLTCGEFRDLIVNVCVVEEIDYKEITKNLPERLSLVEEDDDLYLTEFLAVYETVCEELHRKTPERVIPQKNVVYVYRISNKNQWIDEFGTVYDTNGCEEYESDETREIKEKQCVKAMVIDNRILYIDSLQEKETTIPNVWVISAREKEVTLFAYGEQKQYETELPLEQSFTNTICDCVVSDGKISKIICKTGRVNDKVLTVSQKGLELEEYGLLEFADNFRIYKIYGELSLEKTGRILVGYSIADFVIEDGKICAALIKEPVKTDKIRVLISTNGYKDYYHQKMELTADREYTVTKGGETKYYSAGERVAFYSATELADGERIYVSTVGGEGKIQLSSLTRNYGIPSYRGNIEIAATEKGLLVINELSLEEYLYSVVPSEMPTSYGVEALKVQAICARSYAFNQMMASRYQTYGAHVDDSVNCQVYNNVEENEDSILAVKDTHGLVAAYEGNVITAYYYSTSCGLTAYYEEVWENANPLPYLVGTVQDEKHEQKDFSNEDRLREFLMQENQTYDSEFSWYRWTLQLTANELLKRVQENTKIDCVTGIEVSKRGKSGIAMELKIYGKNGTESVEKTYSYQTAIRKILAPDESSVIKKDGNTVEGMSLLPSAFFVLDGETKDGKLQTVTITGGGYGHGTGMSQNGVKGLIEAGKSFEDIIAYYYQGTDLIFLY